MAKKNENTINSIVSVNQSLNLAHVVNVLKYQSTKITVEAYTDTESKIANLRLRLGRIESIDALTYSDLSDIAKLCGSKSSYSWFDKKDNNGKLAEPLTLSCNGSKLVFTILGRKYDFTTIDNVAHTHLMIKALKAKKHADSTKYDALTCQLYKSVDSAVVDYLKGKGVFNWNLSDKVETYRAYMRDCLNNLVTVNDDNIKAILKAEAEALKAEA